MQTNDLNLIKNEGELICSVKIRCVKCNALLFKKMGKISNVHIEIKCRKCGYVNNIIINK